MCNKQQSANLFNKPWTAEFPMLLPLYFAIACRFTREKQEKTTWAKHWPRSMCSNGFAIQKITQQNLDEFLKSNMNGNKYPIDICGVDRLLPVN